MRAHLDQRRLPDAGRGGRLAALRPDQRSARPRPRRPRAVRSGRGVLRSSIGQIADRFDRRVIAGTCQIVKAICAAVLALGTVAGLAQPRRRSWRILFAGTARAFEMPTHALDRARHRAAGAAAARHRGVGDRAADRHDLRAGARRLPLRARAGDGLRCSAPRSSSPRAS